MSQKLFNALLKEYDATPCPNDTGGHIITLQGQRLWCKYAKGTLRDGGDWIFSRWLTGNPALLDAYKALKGSNYVLAPETEASTAAYNAYAASQEADRVAIKAKGLPHNNPYSLKWNHGGYGEVSPFDSFKQGLAAIKSKGQ